MGDSKSVARILRFLRDTPVSEDQLAKIEDVLFRGDPASLTQAEQLILSMEMWQRQVAQNPTVAGTDKLRKAIEVCERKLDNLAAQTMMATQSFLNDSVTSMNQADLKAAIHDVICKLKARTADMVSLSPHQRMQAQGAMSNVLAAASKLVQQGDLESAYFLLLGLNRQLGDTIDAANGVYQPMEI